MLNYRCALLGFPNLKIKIIPFFDQQEFVLKHSTFTCYSSSEVELFELVVDLALENQDLPRLAEALLHKASKIIPHTGLAEFYMKKYQKDQKNYNLILSKVDVNFSLCPNCQEIEVRCLNRQKVTLG